ncbi:MAG TPA: NAD(P)H-dependent oxidoreductase [Opitutaceae bacterium]|nr:NAD(P)H-dependent oxidoreductase [Opitutaceae bacterium]
MRISIVLSHPNPGSFNHALAAAARRALAGAGHQVAFHDLHAEGFDPVYGAEEHRGDAGLPPLVALHVEEICAAGGIVIVHPNYWNRPPAMLCGWTDRVLREGRAFRFVPDGKGGGRPEGLLRLRFAFVVTTANTPREVEVGHYGDPLDQHWRKVVFGLCGVPRIERVSLTPIITSSPEQRAAWLTEVSSMAVGLASAKPAAGG